MTCFLYLWWLAGTLLPLGVVWGLWRLALRRERCFGYNRALLLLAPVLAAAWAMLPHPARLGPDQFLLTAPNLSGAVKVVVLPALYVRAADAAVGWAGWPWLVALYGLGMAVGLARLAYRYGQLRRATRRLPSEARAGYRLAYTGGRLPTSSWGRTVFWDETAGLTPAEAAPVLAHELAHVRQAHSYDVLWLELWRIVLWPNPFAHLLLPALRLTHELLADQAAASATPAGVGATPYPALLARLAARPLAEVGSQPLLQPFAFSSTLTRIAMLKNRVPVRRWKQWLLLPTLGGAFLVACQTAPDMQSVIPPPPPPPSLAPPEQMPQLPGGGGPDAIAQAIQKLIVYPQLPKSEQRDGQEFVIVAVSPTGQARVLAIRQSLGPAYDAAVRDAISKLPVFSPGIAGGKPVDVGFTVPVLFKAR